MGEGCFYKTQIMYFFNSLWLPFGYTVMRYYSNWRSLLKYVLTEHAILLSLSLFLGATFELFLVSFIQFYSVYDIGYLDNDYNARRSNEEIRIWSKKSFERIKEYSGSVIKTKLWIAISLTSLLLIRGWGVRYILSFLLLIIFFWFNRVSGKKTRVFLFITLSVFKPIIIILNSLSEVRVLLSLHSLLILSLSLSPYLGEKIVEYIQIKITKTKDQIKATQTTISLLFLISVAAFKIKVFNLNDLVFVVAVGAGSVVVKKLAVCVKLRTQLNKQ